MGLFDKLTSRAIDRAVDKAVDKAVGKTVDTVVDATVGKAVRKTVTEQGEKMVTKETEIAIEALLHCSKCGATIAKTDVVCPSCGAEIEAEKFQAIEQLEQNKQQSLDAIEQEKLAQQQKEQSAQGQTAGGDGKLVAWLKQKNDTADTTADYNTTEIEASKILCVFAYLFWLVLIPLFAGKDLKFARFHANQGVVLAICETIWWVLEIVIAVLLGGIPFIGTLVTVLFGLVNIVFAVLIIVGIMNVLNGKAKELPVIGKFRVLK